ncbi:MAG: B12-binding domain-containing radical SAM protein [Methanobrevibacter sp.]|nr:B12-binding domain-containing radical SAM protein [Candidatus Methanoflexus mossambicus]
MKIAIVYPNINLSIIRKRGTEGAWIQHGIASIISYADELGEKIDLIDLRRVSKWKDFENLVKDYDLVGYSVTTLDYENAIQAIKIQKNINKNSIAIVGGIDPSIDSKKYVDNPLIDSVIVGEGEIAFYDIIKKVKNNMKLEECIIGEKINDLDSIKFIDRSLWKKEPPYFHSGLKEPFFTLIASRSCMYNCRFCQPSTKKIFGKKERFRSPENFVSEIAMLHKKYGLKSFYILDDNAFGNRDWLKGFVEHYTSQNIDAEFMVSARADNIYKNRDLLPKLKKLGLKWVNVGFESGSDKILRFIKKGATVELNYRAAKILHDNNINILAFLLFGFPEETKKDINSSFDFIRDIKPELTDPTTYSPFPGTDLYKEYKERDLIYPGATSSIAAPQSIKIKNVDYLYINWIIFRIGFFTSRSLVEKFKKIIYFFVAGTNILIQKIKLN